MSAGKYPIRVRIERITETRDAHGQPIQTWNVLAKRWANIEDSGGRELYRAQQVDAEITGVVTLREQYSGLTSKDRIVLTDHNGNDRTLNIRGITGKSDTSTRRGQVIHVTENV